MPSAAEGERASEKYNLPACPNILCVGMETLKTLTMWYRKRKSVVALEFRFVHAIRYRLLYLTYANEMPLSTISGALRTPTCHMRAVCRARAHVSAHAHRARVRRNIPQPPKHERGNSTRVCAGKPPRPTQPTNTDASKNKQAGNAAHVVAHTWHLARRA